MVCFVTYETWVERMVHAETKRKEVGSALLSSWGGGWRKEIRRVFSRTQWRTEEEGVGWGIGEADCRGGVEVWKPLAVVSKVE